MHSLVFKLNLYEVMFTWLTSCILYLSIISISSAFKYYNLNNKVNINRYSNVFSNNLDSELSKIDSLKSELFKLCSTCDRGFGSNMADRRRIEYIVDELNRNSNSKIYTEGIYPFNDNQIEKPLLEGVWKLSYTTALDVLSLSANPITQLQGIYQVISSNGDSVNVIDFLPKFESILPVSIRGNSVNI